MQVPVSQNFYNEAWDLYENEIDQRAYKHLV